MAKQIKPLVKPSVLKWARENLDRDVRTVIVDGEMLVDDGKYLRLNEEELLEKVQAKGEQIWDSVPKWHWTERASMRWCRRRLG